MDETEKLFIIRWVNKVLISHDKIYWVKLVKEIEATFGKRISENTVKNYWYLKGKDVELTPLDRLCIACADAFERDFR